MPIVDDPKCSNSQICAGETKQSSFDCMVLINLKFP